MGLQYVSLRRLALNPKVEGSNPSRPTTNSLHSGTSRKRRRRRRIAAGNSVLTPFAAACRREYQRRVVRRRVFLHVGHHVAVGVQRDRDAVVPEALVHNLGMHARLEQVRRVAVAQVVEQEG